jgi:hypothetical protein
LIGKVRGLRLHADIVFDGIGHRRIATQSAALRKTHDTPSEKRCRRAGLESRQSAGVLS